MKERYKYIDAINQKLSENQKKSISIVRKRGYKYKKYYCPVCQSKDFEKLAERDRFGLRADVVICKKCGLVMTNPKMINSSYKDFYENFYRDIYSKGEIKNYFKMQVTRGKHILKYICNKLDTNFKNKSVLEVGCGAGGILKTFKNNDNRIVGIDLGEEYVNYGKQEGLDLFVANIEEENISKNKYDLIIFSHVLEHLSDPIKELEKASRLLNENGIIYVEVPGIKGMWRKADFDFLDYLQNAHIWHFTNRTLKNIFKSTNLEVLYSDEFIRAIVRPKINNMKEEKFESDYISVKKYLKVYELLYFLKLPAVINFSRKIVRSIQRRLKNL